MRSILAALLLLMLLANASAIAPEAENAVGTAGSLEMAAPEAPPPTPDLAPVSCTGMPQGVTINRTFVVQSAVRNAGAGSAGSFVVSFLVTPTPGSLTGSTLVGSRYVTGLASGATSSAATLVTVPSNLAAGTYYFVMGIDFEHSVYETNDQNNLYFDPSSFTLASSPDLVAWVASGGLPASPILDRRCDLQFVMQNAGTAPSGYFAVGYYLSGDGTITHDDIKVSGALLGGLAAGEITGGMTGTMIIPASVPPGVYYVGLIIDDYGEVVEGNEINNAQWAGPVTLAASPDLVPGAYAGDAPRTVVNRTFALENSVRNIGSFPAEAFSVAFYLSPDPTVTATDTLVGVRFCGNGLAAGGTTPTERTFLTVPPSMGPGTYWLGMVVDSMGAVAEGDEFNNLASNASAPVTLTWPALPLPGTTAPPHDSRLDGVYDDLNGNGHRDFADIVLYFNQMTWIALNEPRPGFDYNANGSIDFADVVWLFSHL